MKVSAAEIVAGVVALAATALITADSLAVLSVAVLSVGYKLLTTDDGLVVLFLAFCYQWMQVSVGLFYAPLTGRQLLTSVQCDYRPMVLMGLGAIVAMAGGIRAGIYTVRRRPEPDTERPQTILTWPVLVVLYVVALAAEPIVSELAHMYATWRQVLITAAVAHLAILFMMMRRLVIPELRWQPLLFVLAIEVGRGFTGYFAGFKEPLVLTAIVLLEAFDRRRVAHWIAVTVLAAIMLLTATLWIGVRGTYRAEVVEVEALSTSQSARFHRISSLGTTFLNSDISEMKTAADNLADRMWAVYYPALAVARVPGSLPHTNGALMRAAIEHVLTPRIFFPDKPSLISDSELVRKYSGVWVAGDRENTSIAFGYVGESYIDYGVPLMFLPVLVFGFVMGIAYAWLVRHLRHVDLMVATVNVIFWLALYMFERSWANTLGNAVSLLVYLAIPIAMLDDFLLVRFILRRRQTHLEELL